ncbi:MAG: ArnT family glycosyltransferase [Chthoniobacteraceae bacterium]
MNRWLAYLFVVLFWAAAYLPGLGTKALKGEEARRSLPAIEMLETGDWLVPHLNGAPYLRKPPLINWAIAASLYVVNYRDEWVVRLPSVLAMLAMASVLFWTALRWLSLPCAFAAAVISLSSIGLWEKGSLAEIDAMYSALTGMAFAVWIAAWARRETGWRLWLFPGLCLGVAMLAKGPLNLLLFYGVIIPLLVAAGEQRQLWSRAHAVALGLGLIIVAAWVIPYLQATAALDPGTVWADQMQSSMGRGKASKILANELSTLANGLPWLLFVPLLWWRKAWAELEERQQLLITVLRWPLTLAFLGLTLIPGMLPRYTLPLSAAVSLLLAMVLPAVGARFHRGWKWFCVTVVAAAMLAAIFGPLWGRPGEIDWLAYLPCAALGVVFLIQKRHFMGDASARLAVLPALSFAAVIAVYAAVGVPRFHEEVPVTISGRGITEAVPRDATLAIVDPGYEPVFFYIERPLIFVPAVEKLPEEAHYILLAAPEDWNINGMIPGGKILGTFPGQGSRQLVLIFRGDGPDSPVAQR